MQECRCKRLGETFQLYHEGEECGISNHIGSLTPALSPPLHCGAREQNTKNKGEEDDIIQELKGCFYGMADKAQEFLDQITGMKPKQITTLVNQWVKAKRISYESRHRRLWQILHDNGCYPRSESNWDSQVD